MSFGARMLRGGGDLALWRSEEMELVQVIVPAEAAHGTVAKLGALGTCEFRDLNAGRSAFQRTYANQVKRCDELELPGGNHRLLLLAHESQPGRHDLGEELEEQSAHFGAPTGPRQLAFGPRGHVRLPRQGVLGDEEHAAA